MKHQGKKWSNPKRGGPGILLTCETGRERKCQNEGLEILKYYLSDEGRFQDGNMTGGDDDEGGEEDDSLTLEEELTKLRSKKESTKSDPSSAAFGVYETGCRGSVFVLCTLPNCQLIPPIETEYIQAKKDVTAQKFTATDDGGDIRKDDDDVVDGSRDGSDEDSSSEDAKKKRKLDDGSEVEQNGNATSGTALTIPSSTIDDVENGFPRPVLWDPIATVQNIMSDLDAKSRKAPSSRFVTRMIPLQATCFASLEELRLTTIELLKIYLPAKTKTFAIVPRRRHCDSLTRDQIIDTIAEIVLNRIPSCKVQLDNPDATIVVEICKNICGISVVGEYESYRNFNLFAAKKE